MHSIREEQGAFFRCGIACHSGRYVLCYPGDSQGAWGKVMRQAEPWNRLPGYGPYACDGAGSRSSGLVVPSENRINGNELTLQTYRREEKWREMTGSRRWKLH
jgi:hypothetical protein